MSTMWHCANSIINRKEIHRTRKINGAIAQCEAAKLSLEKKQDALGLKMDQHRVQIRTMLKQGHKTMAKQKLRQLKLYEQKEKRIQVQHEDMDRKIMILNDLLVDSDVTNVIKNVAGAMETLDVDQQLSDLDAADASISEALSDASELSQRLEDSARLNQPFDFDEAELEAELAVFQGPPTDPPGEQGVVELPSFPIAPTTPLTAATKVNDFRNLVQI